MEQADRESAKPRAMSSSELQAVAGYVLVFGFIFYPIAGSLFSPPHGHRVPEDLSFLFWSLPLWGIGIGFFVLSRIFSFGSVWRSRALHVSIPVLFVALFMTANDYLRQIATEASMPPPLAMVEEEKDPKNSYTCTRKADGGMACLNAFGEASPNYSYTVTRPSE